MKPIKGPSALNARADRWARVAVVCGAVVAAVLLIEAVRAGLSGRTTDMFINAALALGVLGEVAFHLLATRDSDAARAPRALGPYPIHRIAEKLEQFSGTEYVAGINAETEEILSLLEALNMALRRAGWRRFPCPPSGDPRRFQIEEPSVCKVPRVENVRVLVLPGLPGPEASAEEDKRRWAALVDAGKALAVVLNAEGIEVKFDRMELVTSETMMLASPTASMHLLIGPKT